MAAASWQQTSRRQRTCAPQGPKRPAAQGRWARTCVEGRTSRTASDHKMVDRSKAFARCMRAWQASQYACGVHAWGVEGGHSSASCATLEEAARSAWAWRVDPLDGICPTHLALFGVFVAASGKVGAGALLRGSSWLCCVPAPETYCPLCRSQCKRWRSTPGWLSSQGNHMCNRRPTCQHQIKLEEHARLVVQPGQPHVQPMPCRGRCCSRCGRPVHRPVHRPVPGKAG